MHMSPFVTSVLLLMCSNVFMTFAWYAHLKNLGDRPWLVAAFVSWGIALFEYLLQVPANRVGYHLPGRCGVLHLPGQGVGAASAATLPPARIESASLEPEEGSRLKPLLRP